MGINPHRTLYSYIVQLQIFFFFDSERNLFTNDVFFWKMLSHVILKSIKNALIFNFQFRFW